MPRYRLAAAKRDTEQKMSFAEGFRKLLARRDLRVRLLGASLAWFLMDFAYYGNTVSSPMVLHALAPKSSLLHETLTQLAVFAAAAVPGYFVAAAMMDRMGRKPIQVLGFLMMALSFTAMATTFVYPAELFPVEGRTTGHGIASAMVKIGGFVGVFTFPILMSWHGLLTAELGAALASVLGLIVTLGMVPETKGRSLEELSEAPATVGTREAAFSLRG